MKQQQQQQLQRLSGLKQNESGEFYYQATDDHGNTHMLQTSPPVQYEIINRVIITGPDGKYSGGFLGTPSLKLRKI